MWSIVVDECWSCSSVHYEGWLASEIGLLGVTALSREIKDSVAEFKPCQARQALDNVSEYWLMIG